MYLSTLVLSVLTLHAEVRQPPAAQKITALLPLRLTFFPLLHLQSCILINFGAHGTGGSLDTITEEAYAFPHNRYNRHLYHSQGG